jgi:putative sigma-54 modulation protein
MEIKVQFVRIPTSEHLEEFAIKKLKKLGKRFNWIIKADVFYNLEKDPKGKGKICDIKLSHAGPQIFASSNEVSFEEATDETIRDIEKQLEKLKSEMKPYQ